MRPPPSLEELHDALLGGATATEVLTRLFGGPVVARKLASPPVALTLAQRGRLRLHAEERVVHRRVNLLAAGRPVSEADLWYIPGRLAGSMARQLMDTDVPFGAVVGPLRPLRQTLATRLCPDSRVLALEAMVLRPDGTPIALTSERYGTVGRIAV